MTVLGIDRTLKQVLLDIIAGYGYNYDEFKQVITEHYKKQGDEKRAAEYLKKIKSSKITWKTLLQTLGAIAEDGTDIKMGIIHRLPISSSEYGKPKIIWYPLVTFDQSFNDLSPTELSLFLSEILEESGVSQPIYVNRIVNWLMSRNPSDDTSTTRIKAGGFIKKVSGDNITWTTFIDALKALEAKSVNFKLVISKPDGVTITTSTKIIGDPDDQ